MALSTNERLADSQIKRQLQLQRLASHEANKVLAIMYMLNDELKKMTIEVDPAAVASLKYRNERVRKLMDEGEAIIGTRFAEAYREFRSDMYDFAGLEMAHATESINSAVGFVVAKTVAGKETVRQIAKAIVNDAYIEGGLLKEWFARASENYRMGFQKELRAGMAAGEGIEKIVRRIIGGKREFPGEPSLYDKQRKGMERLVRTAVMTVANDARQKVYKENESLFRGYYWLATLDDRTCQTCAVYDLKEWDLNKQPVGHEVEYHETPMHHNCRCVILPKLKTYRDLGFDIDTREGKRASSGGYVPRDMDFEAWISRQPDDVKRNYFGPGRYELYKAGKITFTDLITQKGRPLTLDELRDIRPDTRITNLVRGNAVIEDKKILSYCLNKDHKTGGHKALIFDQVLGYNASNAGEFSSAIMNGLSDADKRFIHSIKEGDKFEAIMELAGPTGRTATVKTGWILEEGKDTFRMTTAYIVEKRKGR